MARTKASVGAKVSSGKSSKARCSVAPPSSAGGSSSSGEKASRSHAGGNPVCHRETPAWQKAITTFFVSKGPGDQIEDAAAGSSKSKKKRNVIESDEEDDQKQRGNGEDELKTTENGDGEHVTSKNGEDEHKTTENGEETQIIGESEKPKNHALDETIELEPLNGEDSHKIEEYYSKNSKGKGKGKKTKGKENVDLNVERRSSVKRDLEEITVGEDNPHPNKKIKVN